MHQRLPQQVMAAVGPTASAPLTPAPRRAWGPLARLLARAFLGAFGWRLGGERPSQTHYVLVAAPHTSNWDFPLMVACAVLFDVKLSFFGKHTLFRGPLGWALRRLGGIPVDRRAPQDLVRTMAERFAASDRLVLAVPAEGTRAYRDHWKSGFYHIARAAGVPVVLSWLDQATRTGGLGPALRMTGDVRADMDAVRAFYADKRARHPALFSRIRLREEDTAAAAPDAAPQAAATL